MGRSSGGRRVGITARRKAEGNGGKRRQKRIEEELDPVGERGQRRREYERERGCAGWVERWSTLVLGP